uniref:Uncharacterized protein TCIL3000_11_16910 n=1 Tax=Trypanosoma congolense (strain IL3000) TaxID=1068625 RepID=G0V3F4_TRYCI|nr:unnamed protein product [Trypanosoma congolense IL3000]
MPCEGNMRPLLVPLFYRTCGWPGRHTAFLTQLRGLHTCGFELPSPLPRGEVLAQLSDEVFSKGNVHLKNVTTLSALPEGLHSFPEVCFIGKPNVGKSSIISCLLRNPRLGRAGKVRGTTQLMQFFNVGDALLLVDTPGYGGWRGRNGSQLLAKRACAFAILFQYLALRKRGPLKRVYWVMEATRFIQPRDEEIFTFLQREKISFTVILNKIDLFHGNHAAFHSQVRHIHKFLGSEEVPVIAVSADPGNVCNSVNITALRRDITRYCTSELTRTGNWTYKGVRELSYGPPSLDDICAVERRYPVESFVVPQDDNLSLKRFVSLHNEAKLGYLAASTSASKLSVKEKIETNLLDNDSTRAFGVVTDVAMNYGRITTNKTSEKKSLDNVEASAEFVGAPCFSEKATSFHFRPLLWGESRPNLEGGVSQLWRGDAEPHSPTPSPASTHKIPTLPSAAAAHDSSDGVPLSSAFSPYLGAEADTVRTITGVCIPRSMIPASVARLSSSQPGSFQEFAQHSGAGAYEKLVGGDSTLGDVFLERASTEGAREVEDRVPARAHTSARRRSLDTLLKKYVTQVRKKRSVHMQAEGYMCPWLAGAGQVSSTVTGITFGHAHIGSMELMKGLKRTGFGGQSYSVCTMKNRGRSTKKTGFWAT